MEFEVLISGWLSYSSLPSGHTNFYNSHELHLCNTVIKQGRVSAIPSLCRNWRRLSNQARLPTRKETQPSPLAAGFRTTFPRGRSAIIKNPNLKGWWDNVEEHLCGVCLDSGVSKHYHLEPQQGTGSPLYPNLDAQSFHTEFNTSPGQKVQPVNALISPQLGLPSRIN